MSIRSRCVTPFSKQCFVTAGVALNMSTLGMAVAYPAILLLQLENPNTTILVDIDSESWIASLVAFTQIIGTFSAVTIMHKYGRKLTNILSLILAIVSWLVISISETITMIYVGRIIQGIAYGMTAAVCPALIGEYSSPRFRGMFLGIMTLAVTIGIVIVHGIGTLITWQVTAVVCAATGAFGFLIALLSPESPSWLVHRGRYEEGRKNYVWLRGDGEEEELKGIIEDNEARDKSAWPKTLRAKVRVCLQWLRKREFYMPIFIMVHIFGILNWGGVNFISGYLHDVIYYVVGECNVSALVIGVAIQRLVSHICAIFIVTKVRRRLLLIVAVGSSIIMYLVIAIYTYLKERELLPYDDPIVGGLLIHLQLITVVMGSVTLPFMLAGELYSLEHKSLAIGITNVFFSIHFIISVKTFPYLVDGMGFHGTYLLCGGITLYCLVVAWIYLPETKDRTLQDIENEFRGRRRRVLDQGMEATQPLKRPPET